MRGGHDIDPQLSTAATAMAQPRLRPRRDGSGGACAAEAKPAPPMDPAHSTPLPTGASMRASDINHGSPRTRSGHLSSHCASPSSLTTSASNRVICSSGSCAWTTSSCPAPSNDRAPALPHFPPRRSLAYRRRNAGSRTDRGSFTVGGRLVGPQCGHERRFRRRPAGAAVRRIRGTTQYRCNRAHHRAVPH